MNFLWVWLLIFIVALIVEAVTVSLVTIWVCIGASVALILNMLGVSDNIQIITFLVVTFISFLVGYKKAKKYLITHKGSTGLKSNIERYIGQSGICTQEVDNILGSGRVTVLGTSWSAKSNDGKNIKVNDSVEVIAINGATAIVKIKAKTE